MLARTRNPSLLIVCLAVACVIVTLPGAIGQSQESEAGVLLTVVLHQEDDLTVEQMRSTFEKNDFQAVFPPRGARVESWHGVLGLGHVITLRLPAHQIPEVRQDIEEREWGDIRPRLYTSYDYRQLWREDGGRLGDQPSRSSRTNIARQRLLIAP
jgi:hypothetical protein